MGRRGTCWISYVNKSDATREAKELRALRRKQKMKTKVKIEEKTGGEALNKFRTKKNSRYVKTKKRYCVMER